MQLNNENMIADGSVKLLPLDDQGSNTLLQFLQLNMDKLKISKTEKDGLIKYDIDGFAEIDNLRKTPSFQSKKSSNSSTNSKEIIKLQAKQIKALTKEKKINQIIILN